jgi:hypothetical protein
MGAHRLMHMLKGVTCLCRMAVVLVERLVVDGLVGWAVQQTSGRGGKPPSDATRKVQCCSL